MTELKWVKTEFAPGWEDVESDEVVWIDLAKVEASWRKNARYVGCNGTGDAIGERYQNACDWISSGRPIDMVSIVLDNNDEISFTDGRHRFAWLRDNGVTAMPVQTSPGCSKKMAELYGSTGRVSIVPVYASKLKSRLGDV